MAIKVAITDDHLLLINGLVHALNEYKHIHITGTYTNGKDLLKALSIDQPDILLLDLQLPDYMGNELSAKIRQLYPQVRIIILTGLESSFHAKDIMQQGCMGYLFKTSTTPELLKEAIERVYAGETFIDPAVKEIVINDMIKQNSDAHPVLQLSKREKEILQLIVAQMSSPEIAQKLFISHRTVENHRFSLMQKLNVKNAAGLVLKAVQLGIV